MRVGNLLRRLDRRALPPLGDAIHRLGRAPRRLPLLLLAAAAAVALLVAVHRLTGAGAPLRGQTAGDVVRVGVADGQTVAGYVDASRRELRALAEASPPPPEMYALVTLSAYLAPDRLAPVVENVSVLAVYARVPLPQAQTEIVAIDAFRVPEDVVAGMAQVALRKDGDVLDYQELSERLTGDTERERRLRAVYDAELRVAQAEAEAYRRHCSCLYAVVVRGRPSALAALAERPEVRAVDPAQQARRLDRIVFLPPLPEQGGAAEAGTEPARPAPSGREESGRP